jgi:hypothetical protein
MSVGLIEIQTQIFFEGTDENRSKTHRSYVSAEIRNVNL